MVCHFREDTVIYVCVNIYIYTYIYTYVCVCVCVCVCLFVCVRVRVLVYRLSIKTKAIIKKTITNYYENINFLSNGFHHIYSNRFLINRNSSENPFLKCY